MKNRKKHENSFYRAALKAEIIFIVFLLVCIALVARCTPEHHQKDSEEHFPIRNTPITSPSEQREGESEILDIPVTDSNTAIEEGSSSILQAAIGPASYYQDVFQGHSTASGEPYDPNELTAAHKSYPFGTLVRVTNLENRKNVIVRINDRGPHKPDRIIDLSGQAARILGIVEAGIANVRLEILQ